jgi:nucleotide-binding universal stress UspA family protein
VLTVKAAVGAAPLTEEHWPEPGDQAPTAVPIRTILHPTDFSDPSDEAFRVACRLAEDHAARVIVVHVAEPAVPSVGLAASPSLPEDYWGGVEARLGQLQLFAPRVRVECRVEEGNAAAEIVNAARATGCDLIVMGTHGRTGLRRVVMGSVAESVLRTAPCPVMTIKIPLPGSASLAAAPEVAQSRK